MRAALLAAVLAGAVCSQALAAEPLSASAREALKPYLRADGTVDVDALNTALAAPPTPPEPLPERSALHLYVRDSFDDVNLFDDVHDAAGAKGASLLLARDYVAKDTSWGVKGVVLATVAQSGNYGGSLGYHALAYLGFNLDRHSAAGAGKTETYKAGALFEAGHDEGQFSSYFRGRIGIVSDRKTDTTTLASAFEYAPVGRSCLLDRPCNLLNSGLLYTFKPSVLAQYDHATGDKPVPFSQKQDALRVGPAATVRFRIPSTNYFLNHLRGGFTYHYDFETISGKNYNIIDASISYNLDESGHFALTGIYTRGDDQDTGEFTKALRLTLTAKY